MRANLLKSDTAHQKLSSHLSIVNEKLFRLLILLFVISPLAYTWVYGIWSTLL